VRVHARYVVGGGTVGVQECTAGGLAGADDPLLELADGVRVEVRTGDGRVVPGGVTGRLVVDGRDTGDLGWIDPAGALRYEGTARDTVVRYGLALNIPTVERRLVTHPAVADAVVTVAAVGGPHPARDSGAAGGPHRGRGDGTGGGSCAHVQPRPGVELAVPELRRHLRTRARPGELMPSRIHVVPALPRLPDGTADRTALRDSAMPENR
jgi:acyl-coenzyme A synthetase/AMP-(fatty) acid ligase